MIDKKATIELKNHNMNVKPKNLTFKGNQTKLIKNYIEIKQCSLSTAIKYLYENRI